MFNHCVPLDKLTMYSRGQCDAVESLAVEHHLEACQLCCNRLSQLVDTIHGHLSTVNLVDAPEGSGQMPVAPSSSGRGSSGRGSSAQFSSGQFSSGQGHPALDYWLRQNPSAPAVMPEKIGRYRVQKVLGSGGFGVVYLAVDEELDRRVAIKVPHGVNAAHPVQLKLIRSEAKTLASLDHPHIVPIYDVVEARSGSVYLVSKFIEGRNLAERQCEPFGIQQALQWVIQIADALTYAHSRSIIHRDIKPQNILIGLDEVARLTDFGLARRASEQQAPCSSVGTPGYMSPEQSAAQPVIDGRTDVYSLGRVLSELLNRCLGKGDTLPGVPDTLAAISATDVDALTRICARAVAERPEERFGNTEQFANELRAYAARAGWLPHHGSAMPMTQRPAAHWSTAWWGARGLGMTVAGMTVVGIVVLCLTVAFQARNVHAERLRQETRDIEAYLYSSPPEIPVLLERLGQPSVAGMEYLRRAAESRDSDVRVRGQLALLPFEPGLAAALANVMVGSHCDMSSVLMKGLLPFKEAIREQVTKALEDTARGPTCRLNAASFLVQGFPTDPMWEDPELARTLVELLKTDDLVNRPSHVTALRPIKRSLTRLLATEAQAHEDRRSPDLTCVFEIWGPLVQDDPIDTGYMMLECPPELVDRCLDRLVPDEEVFKLFRGILASRPHDVDNPRSLVHHRARVMAAYSLLKLGSPEEFWSLFQHTVDPELAHFVLYFCADSPLTLNILAEHLIQHGLLEPKTKPASSVDESLTSPEWSLRRQLLNTIFRSSRWQTMNSSYSQIIREKLKVLVIEDADPGVQAIAHRTLRGMTPVKDWLDEPWFPKQLVKQSASARSWSLNSLDMIMVHIENPTGFEHSFCLSQREVDCNLFQQFTQETRYQPGSLAVPIPMQDARSALFMPQSNVTWYDCAAFCNWLSRREGLEECYLPNRDGRLAAGMTIKPDVYKLSGYRLPTAAEWEFGCRAGATTRYMTGQLDKHLLGFAWTRATALNVQPPGLLPPNALGLFDTHGNVSEWILDDPTLSHQHLTDPVTDETTRYYRGGCFQSDPATTACDLITPQPPMNHNPTIGFRIARSLP